MGHSFLEVIGPFLGSGAPGHSSRGWEKYVSGWAQWMSAQPGISQQVEDGTHWPLGESHSPAPAAPITATSDLMLMQPSPTT